MLTLLAAAFGLQAQGAAARDQRPDSLATDSARVVADSSRTPADAVPSTERRHRDREPRRISMTPALLASGSSFVAVRPVIFGDLGWAGSRDEWSHLGRPVSGAGVGASFMDGLIRFDIAKGIHPSRGWRTDLYLEARF